MRKFGKGEIASGRTVYSDPLPGDYGNADQEVRVDVTAPGYVGISQTVNGRIERVLLSPDQWRAIERFVNDEA